MRTPLDEGDLDEIDRCLDRGDLDQAQALIALAGENPAYELGTSYLVTRLLYLKGRLDADRVRQRLTDLLARVSPFPQAEAMLASLVPGVPPHDAPPRSSDDPTRAAIAQAPRDAIPAAPPARTPGAVMPPSIETRSARSRVAVAVPLPSATPTEVAMPAAPPPSERPSRRAVVALETPSEMPIPAAPRLPRGQATPVTPRPSMRQLADPRERRSTVPSGRRAEPLVTRTPEEARQDSDAAAAWRERTLGLGPALKTSTPPRGSDRGRLRPRSGGYSIVNGEPSGRSKASNRSDDAARVPSTLPKSTRHTEPSRSPLGEFERAARGLVGHAHPNDVETLAAKAATVLADDPTTTWFAPFDFSLYGLTRCSHALTALTLGQRCVLGPMTLALFGAYVGETIRRSHQGRWSDEKSTADRVVVAGASNWNPNELLRACASHGEPPNLLDRVRVGLAPEGGAAWLFHAPTTAPRALWDNPPRAEELPEVAELVARSPWSRLLGRPLDGGFDSIPTLEPLADQLAQSASPVRGAEVWVERLSLLLGAYVGEAVRKKVGGEWRTAGTTLEGYVLRLPSGFEAEPIAAVRERIRGQNGVRLVGYAQALVRK